MKYLLLLLSTWLYAVEVVVITHKDCPVCQKWHQEVLPNYYNEAKRNKYPPLKTYELANKMDRDYVMGKVGYINYIPMFVIMDDDRVVASFTGYTGYKEFYSDLEEALEEASNA